ncbi:MAG: Rpn family recombination-promoting nuclease/putative transposase, partial [Microcoleaceae cyanobacterium]
RMLDYWVRLYRRHRVPITQTLILLKETASARRLTDTFRVENTQHRYRIIRLWEETPESFLQNPALLPLASLCQTSSPDQLLGKVAEELAKIEGSVERGQIAACTEILAGLRFNKTLIKQLFREDIMRESVIYQDILQQGQKQALKTSILDVLEARFSAAPPELNSQLEALTPEQLRRLLRLASTCVTVNDFISQLA